MRILILNILSGIFVFLTLLFFIFFMIVFINPQSSLNPMPQATLPEVLVLPTKTATYKQLPPTWTTSPEDFSGGPTQSPDSENSLQPSSTSLPTSTSFYLSTRTNTPTFTSTPTETGTPTSTPTKTPVPANTKANTATKVPPTATFTEKPLIRDTNTPVPPTATSVPPTEQPTATSEGGTG